MSFKNHDRKPDTEAPDKNVSTCLAAVSLSPPSEPELTFIGPWLYARESSSDGSAKR